MTTTVANPLAEGLDSGRRSPPVALVVFGASGDLTSRKLLPALERLSRRRQLPPSFALVGVARTELTDDAFRKLCLDAVPDAGPAWEGLVAGFRYVSGEYERGPTFDRLAQLLAE